MIKNKSRLLLIDGLPGSGKSTTAQFLSYQLERNGIRARWFHEFDARNPLFNADEIERKSITNVEEFIKLTLNKWEKLVEELKAVKEVYIIESYLMQCTAGYLFENNTKKEVILDYIKAVYKIIDPLNPLLIYMTTNDVNRAIERLKKLRGKDWVDSHVKRDEKLPYIQAKNLKGFKGWVQMFRDYKKISDEIFQLFNQEKTRIDYTEDNWKLYRQTILKFLALELHPSIELTNVNREKYIGAYEPPSKRFFFSIIQQDNELYLCDYFSVNLRLMPIKKNKFIAESTPHIFRFEENDQGEISKIIHDGRDIYQCGLYEFLKLPNQQIIHTKKTNKIFKIKRQTPKELSEKEREDIFDIITQIQKEAHANEDFIPTPELMKKIFLDPIDNFNVFLWCVYEPIENKIIGFSIIRESQEQDSKNLWIMGVHYDFRKQGIDSEIFNLSKNQ